jgi:sodium/bile acid cotransporter 7
VYQALIRNWFLVLLALGIGAAVLWTDSVSPAVDLLPPRISIVLVLFVGAWTLESGRLWSTLRRPQYALTAMAVAFGLIPALGWAASHLLSVPDYAIGLCIVTSLPCTLAAATMWTRMASGNEATALLITLTTTCTSWLFTISWLTLTTGRAVELDPLALMRDLVFYLIIPVTLGQFARFPRLLRDFAVRYHAALGVVAQLLILVIILQAVTVAADRLRVQGAGVNGNAFVRVVLLCGGIHLVGMGSAYIAGVRLRFPITECRAIAIAGSQKSLPIGLLIIQTYYADFPLAVVSLLCFHVGQLVIDSFVADFMRKGVYR